jgi:hypothetical protein
MSVTIGADPELFFTDKLELRSAILKVGGSKEEPLDIGQGCAVQEDNVAAEFCIPPCEKVADFIKSISYAKNYLEAVAGDYGLSLARSSAGIFSDNELLHPMSHVFGCDPDYNAWTGRVNPRPKAENRSLRSAGGHIHVGTKKDPFEVVKAMDLFLGVPSVSMDLSGKDRRQLYGKAGACRKKSYGVEYRSLSNFWIWSTQKTSWAFGQAVKAEAFAEKYNFTKEDEEMITTCINTSDHELVATLKLKFKKEKI